MMTLNLILFGIPCGPTFLTTERPETKNQTSEGGHAND
jgi:hypothetical protein